MLQTLPAPTVVDITAPASASAGGLGAFDALRRGETLLLRTVGRPAGVLQALREERAGAFEWTPLVEGPGHWEVEIHKRDVPPGVRRGLTEALAWDHERLGALEEAAREAWDAGETFVAARLHLRYAYGLLRHIRFEEAVLLPELERVSGMSPDRGPTAVMRVEHRAIEALLDVLREAAERGVRPPEPARSDLRALLYEHEIKEENVLYPMLDRALDRGQADAVVFRFQAMDPAS